MAREKLKPQREYPDDMDTLPVVEVEPVYDVEVDELNHEELQILATEVGKEQKAAARDEASVDLKVKEIESKIATEEAWDEKVAKVESKVTRIIPKPKGYQNRMSEVRKLDEAQLKVYESEVDASRKAEAKAAEPKRVEHKSNEAKKV